MKKILSMILIILIIVAGGFAFITIDKQNKKIVKLTDQTKENEKEHGALLKTSSDQVIVLSEMEDQIKKIKIQIKENNIHIEEYDRESEFLVSENINLMNEIEYYKARLKIDHVSQVSEYAQNIIKYHDVHVGDIIDGKKITSIEDNKGMIKFSFDGYYVLSGELVWSDYPTESIDFIAYDKQVDKIFNTEIDFGDMMLGMTGGFTITNAELLRDELGEENYSIIIGNSDNGAPRDYMDRVRLPITAVFKNYSIGAKRESEGYVVAEIVTILEIFPPKETSTDIQNGGD